MDYVRALEHVLTSMRQMISESNWVAAKRINEQLLMVLVDGILSEDGGALACMRERLAAFRSEVTIGEREISSRSNVEAFLDANVVFASIAARRRPKGKVITLNVEERGAREVVLELLAEKKFMVTSELAHLAKVRPETMSRLLTSLKAEGLITSKKVGRNVLSRLTLRGERVAGSGHARRPTMLSGIANEENYTVLYFNNIELTEVKENNKPYYYGQVENMLTHPSFIIEAMLSNQQFQRKAGEDHGGYLSGKPPRSIIVNKQVSCVRKSYIN